ncbi:hypothetical protein HY479_02370 [Candidatus Uhrbacteria bacterium]|nr:hypothetical protein [Candidatus Uhrbacteria bacterium]
MSERSIRVEWISLVYLAFFVLAVLSPSLVRSNWFGIEERHVEEVLIFLFGIVGLSIFSTYQRIMERHEREHEDAKNEYDRAKRELVESYKYIGAINRQIDVLKRVANQTSLSIVESDHLAKDLLTTLVSSAAASVGARSAFLRCIEQDKLRTEYEVHHAADGETAVKISNKDLVSIHATGRSHAAVRSEDGREILVVPSDRQGTRLKAYLIIGMPEGGESHVDPSLLKVFVNQAELLRHALNRPAKSGTTPIELVHEAERQAIGVVRSE